jgi:hypothetical protein
MKYIILPKNKYTGDLDVKGPFETEESRDNETQMLLFCDQADLRLYFLDIDTTGKAYTYAPSEVYIDDLRQKWDAL